MKVRAADQLAFEYAAAMQDYLAGSGEKALRKAYELGRQALARGLGALDVLAAYQRCALQTGGVVEAARPEFVRSVSFLAESLSPFEMILRGYQETNESLRRRLDDVARTQLELLRQNESLRSVQLAAEEERRRYRQLFDMGPEACLITDVQGVIREANRGAGSLLYIPHQSLEGRPLLDFVQGENREALERQLRQLGAAGSRLRSEWQVAIRRADSTAVRVNLSVGVGMDFLGGGVSDLLWLLRRVSKRTSRNGNASGPRPVEPGIGAPFDLPARASSILIAAPDLEFALEEVATLAVPHLADLFFVHLSETDGSVRQLTAACSAVASERLTDSETRRALLSRAPRNRPLAHLRAKALDVLTSIPGEWLEQLADNESQLEGLRKVGARSAVVAPLLVDDRTLGVFTLLRMPSGQESLPADLAIVEDLARGCALALERDRLYREAVAGRRSAERASAMKDEFLAILSHELRHPLVPVLGWARSLKNREPIMAEPVLSEGVHSIERNAQHLARLADDCLDLVRISQGKIDVVKALVDLNQVVLASAEAVHEMALSKQLDQAIDLSLEPLWLLGDATRLQQAVVNLLVNAIKYTESRGRILIRSRREDGWAEVQVRDTGIGIPADQIERIFEPFSKGASEWAASGSGLGLGLTIARKIVEMHGGTIRAESRGTGYGSSFHISLALADAIGCKPFPEPGDERAAFPKAPLRILLVEDSKELLFLLKVDLELLGYRVLTAEDGASGLERAVREQPDILVSDIKTPGIDGYELIRRLRGRPETANLPAIALTGLCKKTDVEKALSAGFDACLGKPCEIEELSAVIMNLAAGGSGRTSSAVIASA